MVSSTSIRVRNTTNEETANNKSSFSKRRRPDSAYSSHQSIRDEEVSGEFYKGRSQEKTVLRWLEPNTPRSSHAYPDLDSRNRADAPVATNLIPLKAGEYFAALPVWGAVHGRNAARSSSRLTQPRKAV